MMPTRLHGRTRGFTLIEVLVALTVMAVMALLAWRGIDAMLRSREINAEHLQRTEQLRTLVMQWEQDLRELQDSGQIDALAFDGRNLRLTRRSPGGLQLVVWRLENGRLLRWAAPPAAGRAALLAAQQRSTQLGSSDLDGLPGLGGVQGWEIYFYRNNSWSNAQSSGDVQTTTTSTTTSSGSTTVTTSTRTQLPSGVRMLLRMNDGELTRQVAVESSS